MPPIAWEEAKRAKLFVRSDLPTPAKRCRENLISRLEAFVASGVLEEYAVSFWAKRVPLDAGSNVGRVERDLFEEFDTWAQAAGVTLSPFFDTRECYSSTTGEKQTQLVMPAVCVGLYGDDGLVGVVPHSSDAGSLSIREGFDRLLDSSTDDEASLSVTMAD